jgi:hypothetical protein
VRLILNLLTADIKASQFVSEHKPTRPYEGGHIMCYQKLSILNLRVIFVIDINFLRHFYEGESKIIRNVDTCCAVGYTAGWA